MTYHGKARVFEDGIGKDEAFNAGTGEVCIS